MIPLSSNTLPLIGGLLILLLNVVVSAVRLWRKHLRATVINVVLTLIACVLLAIGVTRITFAASAAGASNPAPAESSLAGGVPASTLPILLTAMGAIMLTGAGLLLFLNERNRADFEPSYSPGLLYIGAGIFGLAVTILIPVIPGTPTPARAAAAVVIATSTGPIPTRVEALNATASYTPTPRPSATEVPSLTPAASATPIVLVTQIVFVSTGVSTTSTGCSVVAQLALNMRGDPSTQNRGMGTVFAGSLLPVTGQSADKKWWRVINNGGVAPVEGWVSAQFVTLNPGCNADAVPVVSDNGTVLSTPSITLTPTQVGQATSAATSAATSEVTIEVTVPATTAATAADAGSAGTPVTCILITTTAVSVRGDPSRLNVPIGQISQGTAVKAIGKTANGQWWHVIFTADGQDGWIGAGAVLVPTSCAAVPSITLTPAS